MNKILGMDRNEWLEKGGIFTAEEIVQQPYMWKLTYEIFRKNKSELLKYYEKMKNKSNLRIIFSGAGTSGFIGDILTPYLKKEFSQFEVLSVHTTEIVTHPETYFDKETPTLLVSFARSGNSPESLATIKLAENMIDDLYQLIITCNKDGKLANKKFKLNDKLILLPEKTNDRGFAMTSSFSSMLLAALLFFNIEKLKILESIIKVKRKSAKKIINDFSKNKELFNNDFKKIIYLGDHSFFGLAKEASLKLLELSSGKIITRYDTPLGFRHGPKSIIDKDSLIVFFISDNEYTLKYEYDLLNELNKGRIGYKTAVIGNNEKMRKKCDFYLSTSITNKSCDEIFNTLEYIIYAQIISLYESIKSDVEPDNPSPDGNVNRVVKGVKIYPYKN